MLMIMLLLLLLLMIRCLYATPCRLLARCRCRHSALMPLSFFASRCCRAGAAAAICHAAVDDTPALMLPRADYLISCATLCMLR